jgi:ribose transport system substrate-binding protein
MRHTYDKSRFVLGIVLLLLLAACGGAESEQEPAAAGGDATADTAPAEQAPATAADGAQSEAGQTQEPLEEEAANATVAGYEDLPFTDILPMEEGPVEIDGETPDITVGFSQTCYNHPWRVAMLDSIEAEANRHPNVEIISTDGNCDIVKQSNDVDDLRAQGVDAIVMSPVESDGLVPAANRVVEAGIPLVVLDRDVFTDKSLYIGQSNVTMARNVAEEMVEALDGEGQILEITGLVGSSPAIDRSQGLAMALEEAPGIELLESGDGEWIREPAVALMEDWLVRFPEIDAVFSHAEESSWGAQLAIGRAGRCDAGIMHFTHDGSSAGFEWVEQESFHADGNYSPFIGDIGLRAALMLLQGEEIPDAQEYDEEGLYLQLPDLPTVTPENAEEWIPLGWGDFEPPADPCA